MKSLSWYSTLDHARDKIPSALTKGSNSAVTTGSLGSAMAKSNVSEFGTAEAKERFEAAPRGARIAGPQYKKSVTPKRRGPQLRKTKKTKV
jgi:hypothetical protein